jgi:hypothetical protein
LAVVLTGLQLLQQLRAQLRRPLAEPAPAAFAAVCRGRGLRRLLLLRLWLRLLVEGRASPD